MTDINELTAKLKAAALEEIMCREACDTSDLWQDEVGPGAVLALTEALEQTQAQSSKWLEAYHKAVSIGARYEERIAELEEIATDYGMKFQRAQDNLKKMALMHRDEARTLTVKLPHWSGYTCSGEGAMLDACVRSLESQGFTVQIEGE